MFNWIPLHSITASLSRGWTYYVARALSRPSRQGPTELSYHRALGRAAGRLWKTRHEAQMKRDAWPAAPRQNRAKPMSGPAAAAKRAMGGQSRSRPAAFAPRSSASVSRGGGLRGGSTGRWKRA